MCPTFLWGQQSHALGTCLGVPGGQQRRGESLQRLLGIPEAKASLSHCPALTLAWMQQACNWRIKEVDSVLCLAKMKNKKIPTNPDTYKRKFNNFFSNECRWGCSFLVLWAFTYKLLCNGSALLLFSVLLMSCTKGQGLSNAAVGSAVILSSFPCHTPHWPPRLPDTQKGNQSSQQCQRSHVPAAMNSASRSQ